MCPEVSHSRHNAVKAVGPCSRYGDPAVRSLPSWLNARDSAIDEKLLEKSLTRRPVELNVLWDRRPDQRLVRSLLR
jgi:hypothetical protein